MRKPHAVIEPGLGASVPIEIAILVAVVIGAWVFVILTVAAR